MKVITLTADQIAALAPLLTARAAALASLSTASQAVQVELASIAGATGKHMRLTLSDDGKSLIVQ